MAPRGGGRCSLTGTGLGWAVHAYCTAQDTYPLSPMKPAALHGGRTTGRLSARAVGEEGHHLPLACTKQGRTPRTWGSVSFMHADSMTWLIRRLSNQDTLPVVLPVLPNPLPLNTPAGAAFHAAGLTLWAWGLEHAMFPSCYFWFIVLNGLAPGLLASHSRPRPGLAVGPPPQCLTPSGRHRCYALACTVARE